jgi:methylglutaconyl-CoA hydratase
MRGCSAPLRIIVRLGVRPCSRQYSTPSLIRTETFAAPHVGNIRLIALNRPEARNAISRSLLAALKAEIDVIDTAPTATRALIITSDVPGIFCAGADLKERATLSMDE